MPELASPLFHIAAIGLVSYLLGSIAFGIVVARVMGLGDLRSIGSGNIGTSNMLRTGSRTGAALTLVLDAGKGFLPVLFAALALGSDDAIQTAALLAFIGHLYPVWHGFRGGKGVATYFGVLYAMMPIVALVSSVVWITVATLFRISSVAAITTCIATPFIVLLFGNSDYLAVTAIFTLMILYRHRDNIGRLRDGTESKIRL